MTEERPVDEARAQQAEVAALLGVIERMAADLALAEEPARFIAVLEAARPTPEDAPPA
jgi:hypothetical protein